MVSKASDDFPDPLTPVMTTSERAGNVTSTFLRLCVRAPRTTIWPRAGGVLAMVPRCSLARNRELCMVTQGFDRVQPRQPRRGMIVGSMCYFYGRLPGSAGSPDLTRPALTR